MSSIITAILSRFSLDTIIEFLLSVLLRAVPGLWSKAKELVAQAELTFPLPKSGTNKKAWVQNELLDWLKAQYGIAAHQIKPHMVEIVVGMAVAEMEARLKRFVGMQALVTK